MVGLSQKLGGGWPGGHRKGGGEHREGGGDTTALGSQGLLRLGAQVHHLPGDSGTDIIITACTQDAETRDVAGGGERNAGRQGTRGTERGDEGRGRGKRGTEGVDSTVKGQFLQTGKGRRVPTPAPHPLRRVYPALSYAHSHSSSRRAVCAPASRWWSWYGAWQRSFRAAPVAS